MFSVSTAVVLLVFFVSQALGQNGTTSPNVTTSPSNSSSSNSTNTPITPTKLITTTSEQPTTPSEKTCAKLGVVIDKLWNDTYKNSTSDNFRHLSDAFSSALKNKVYSDPEKYTNVEVSEEHFTKKGDKVLAKANLSLVFKGGDEVFIEDVFKNKVATGELDVGLTVIKDSAEFEPQGVLWKDWKAKDGECKEKCEGAAGPFFIVRECEDARCSCKGHKTTKETKECTTYCPSTGAVSVSSVILVIGIFLSSSFL